MNFEGLLTFFLTIFIFSITPGPGVLALLARGINLGAKECFSLALGMSISDVLYLIFACFGLSTLAHNYGLIFEIIRFIGALYLFYLAYKMFTSPIKIDEIKKDKMGKKDFIFGFIQGFFISASNPKVILFYIAFLPTILDIKSLSVSNILLISLLAFSALMLGLMSISILANKAKKVIKSEKSMKRVNYTTGSILIAAASYLLLNKQS